MSHFNGTTGTNRAIRGWALILLGLVTASACQVETSIEAPEEENVDTLAVGNGGSASNRPNVLVVMTDDQRDRDTMAVMDFTRRLFKRNGVEYKNAFATTPVCCPSRATIFTGQYVHNHGVFTNGESDLPQSETVQRYLDEAGYRTAIFGKYLNAWNIDEDPPHFDRFSVYANSKDVYGEAEWNELGTVKDISEYPVRYIRRQATDFLKNYAEDHDDHPWLMFLTPPSPHLPSKPERKYEDLSVGEYKPNRAAKEKNRSDKPDYVTSRTAGEKRTGRLAEKQLRSLASVDDLMERVTRQMKRLDETRKTLVLFLSDNGFLWAEHGMIGSIRSKANPYSESIGIPMLLRWPKKISGSKTDSRFVSNVDVGTTILDAARLTTDPGRPMDGNSMLKDTWNRRKMFFEYYPTKKSKAPRWNSLRTAKYQYIEYYKGGHITFREYYDMKEDPWQLVNLFEDGRPSNDPGKARLHKRIKRYEDCKGNECP